MLSDKIRLFGDPMEYSPPGSSIHGILQKEYWTELPFLSPGVLRTLGMEQGLLNCRQVLYSLATRSVQFSSVTQSFPTVCNPMNRSTPGHPVHHQLMEFTQTHIHRVSDAIQPSHPLSSRSPPAPNSSQHQSLFQ